MKPIDWLHTLSDIDETLIADADASVIRARRQMIRRMGVLAACLVLIVGIGIWTFPKETYMPSTNDNHNDSTEEGVVENNGINDGITTTTTTVSSEPQTTPANNTTTWATSNVGTYTTVKGAYRVPRWNERAIYEQFTDFQFQGEEWTIKSLTIPADKVGKRLETVTLEGYDMYEKVTHTTTATLYTLDDVSEKCAVAVQYEGYTDYYPAVFAWYRPDTLGDLIDDLNLRDSLSFGNISYQYFDDNNTYHRIKFSGTKADDIWQWLLSDTTLQNVYDDQAMYVSDMSISISVPSLGYLNYSLGVTEDGYLTTNVLETGKAFFIGKDKAAAFMEFVKTHYEGVELVYTTKTTLSAASQNSDDATRTTMCTSTRTSQPKQPN